jgi:hypothetical protein
LNDQSAWSLPNLYDLALKLNLPELMDKSCMLKRKQPASRRRRRCPVRSFKIQRSRPGELGSICQRKLTAALTSGFVMNHLLVER